MNLHETLNIAKSTDTSQPSPQNVARKRMSPSQIPTVSASSIDALDSMVYGKPVTEEKEQPEYNADLELERLKMGLGAPKIDTSTSKIPRSILEDVINNPLEVPAVDPRMDALTERLGENLSGIQRVNGIMEKMEQKDNELKQALMEESGLVQREKQPQQQYGSSGSQIDYSLIKAIVESVLSEKMSELKSSLLTESVGAVNGLGNVKIMKIGTDSNFHFLDSKGNVFECKLIFKGKKK